MRLPVATDTSSAAAFSLTASLSTPTLTRIGRSGRVGTGDLHDCALKTARTTFSLASTRLSVSLFPVVPQAGRRHEMQQKETYRTTQMPNRGSGRTRRHD